MRAAVASRGMRERVTGEEDPLDNDVARIVDNQPSSDESCPGHAMQYVRQ